MEKDKKHRLLEESSEGKQEAPNTIMVKLWWTRVSSGLKKLFLSILKIQDCTSRESKKDSWKDSSL